MRAGLIITAFLAAPASAAPPNFVFPPAPDGAGDALLVAGGIIIAVLIARRRRTLPESAD